jgi:multisubunit Na+/H+ antiporter MnhB subunit
VKQEDTSKTILVIVTGTLALAWIFNTPVLGKVALAIGVISIIIPAAARGIEWGWLKLAQGLGWVNSRILLSLIYFLFLLPLAWVSRLFTKDPMALKRNNTKSLFITRDHLYTAKDLENIW